MTDILHLSERDVVESVTLEGAIVALEDMLRTLARGEARNVAKTFATFGEGAAMHALGSLMPMRGYLGFKTWAITPRGGGSIFTLFDANTGTLLALIEARALGQLRTSAITGVATRLLSPPDAQSLALIGTGAQAMLQLAAVAAVRQLTRVTVFSPTPQKRRHFADAAAKRFGLNVTAADSVAAAADGAEIVTLITRAREPFLDAGMLLPRAHVNAVGAILPTHAEFAQDVFDRTDVIAVDDLENARRGSRELIERSGAAEHGWNDVRTLGDLLLDGFDNVSPRRVTLFKGMGMGLSDLALATLAYESARARGTGRSLPAQERIHPLDAASRIEVR